MVKSLLDLPSEILTSVAELLVDFAETTERTKPDLFHFLMINQFIYATCREVQYRSLIYPLKVDDDETGLLNLLTAVHHVGLSHHIHHAGLSYSHGGKCHGFRSILASVTNLQYTVPEPAVGYLLRTATKLQSLDLEYPEHSQFLNKHSNTIQELFVRQTPSCELAIDFLPFVLKWPRLRTLAIRSSAIQEIQSLGKLMDAITSNSSSVSRLIIESCEIPECIIIALIEASTVLENFVYKAAEYWARNFKIAADKPAAESLPRTSQIAAALSKHNATLKSLAIKRTGKYWNAQMDEFGTFQYFRALKNLQIDATMLFGWNHCEHWRAHRATLSDVHPDSPEEFATHLPTSIEIFTVVIDKMLFSEKLKRYLVSLIEGILARVQSNHLPNLRHVQIKYNGMRYCVYCETDDMWKTHDPPAFVTTYPTMKRVIEKAANLNMELIFGDW